jgi:hypothetical protein
VYTIIPSALASVIAILLFCAIHVFFFSIDPKARGAPTYFLVVEYASVLMAAAVVALMSLPSPHCSKLISCGTSRTRHIAWTLSGGLAGSLAAIPGGLSDSFFGNSVGPIAQFALLGAVVGCTLTYAWVRLVALLDGRTNKEQTIGTSKTRS